MLYSRMDGEVRNLPTLIFLYERDHFLCYMKWKRYEITNTDNNLACVGETTTFIFESVKWIGNYSKRN